MAAKAAKSSLSKVEYFNSVELSFLLKKARGNQDPWVNCCKTPPTCVSDASTASDMTAPGVGCTSFVQFAKAALPEVKAASALSDHSNVLGLPRSKSVNGFRVPAIPGKNLL